MQADSAESKAVIFDIRRFSVHDGPGIRTTVFFKGCPLRCRWCHNPESFSSRPQAVADAGRCLGKAHDCAASCPAGALRLQPRIDVDHGRCDGCGQCRDACPADALAVIGRYLSEEEIMAEIGKDAVFFAQSGGGVTFSGGEPLMQPVLLGRLLKACRALGLHAAVDTSGCAPADRLEALLADADLFLYDLKLADDAEHRRHTGCGNDLILANLRRVSASGIEVQVRIPLIPGITDSEDNLLGIVRILQALPRRHPVSLLPFHRGGRQKYERLGLGYPLEGLQPPPAERIGEVRSLFEKNGFSVTTGE